MALSEKEREKKPLSEIGALIRGYEKKSKDIAAMVGAGKAKPADMLTLSSDLAVLKKVYDKKMNEQGRMVPRGQPKSSEPLKSFEDYERGKADKGKK
jgi:hypothetical protein